MLERALVEHSAALHAERRYREAARSLRLAAEGVSVPRRHRELLLDAEIESVLVDDIARITIDPAVDDEDPRARLIAAMRSQALGEWKRAADILAGVSEERPHEVDPLTAHRVRGLRVWCGSNAVGPPNRC